VQRRSIHPKQEGDSEHAFVADQPYLQAGTAIDRRYQRNETFRGKIDVSNALSGFGKYLGKRQFNRFAACQKSLTVLAGQGRKQAIGSRGRPGERHMNSPSVGKPGMRHSERYPCNPDVECEPRANGFSRMEIYSLK
jgi:hypothetical protein